MAMNERQYTGKFYQRVGDKLGNSGTFANMLATIS